MICSASQIDSFWKTLVLSNDCESSMRAIVRVPPFFGAPAAPEPPPDDEPLEAPPTLPLLPELPPQPASATTAAANRRATPLLLRIPFVPPQATSLALTLRTVYNTQAPMSRHLATESDPLIPSGH